MHAHTHGMHACARLLLARQPATRLACRDLFYACFGTPDQREGMAAFLEKRPAAFSVAKEPAA